MGDCLGMVAFGGSQESVTLRFGRALRARRIELGISQLTLSERTGIHATYISEVEGGKKNPSLSKLEAFCFGLELPVSRLFAEYGADHPYFSSGKTPESRENRL